VKILFLKYCAGDLSVGNLQCPTWAQVLNTWFPVGGAILWGCEALEEGGLAGRRRSLGTWLGRLYLVLSPFPSLCFLAAVKWAASATEPGSSRHDVPSHLRSKAMDPDDHGLNPLKPWAKINPSSLKLFMSGILSQGQEVWRTHMDRFLSSLLQSGGRTIPSIVPSDIPPTVPHLQPWQSLRFPLCFYSLLFGECSVKWNHMVFELLSVSRMPLRFIQVVGV
jgi:hypothetical protein